MSFTLLENKPACTSLGSVKTDFYGRKSTKDDGRSVASQEKDWRSDCAESGNEPGRSFSDPDRSASRYARKARPDYEELLAHIEGGHCEMLALWETSRGDRDLERWARLLSLCRRQNVLIRILSHGRTYDMNNRRDWRTLADEGVDAADESEKISERTLRGKRDAAAEGRPVGRRGYGWIRIYDQHGRVATQEPDPVTGPIVAEIIARIANGEKNGEIAADLNGRGIPTAEGGKWTDRQIRQLAIKPVHAGLRVHRGEIARKGTWEPLIDPVVWERAYARLTSHPATGTSRVSHWLTGAVLCGGCEKGYLRAAPRKNGNAYGCRTCFRVSASARGLEPVLETLVRGRLRGADVAELFAPAVDDNALRAAVTEETALRDRLNQHYAEAAAGRLSATGLSAVERLLLADIKRAGEKVKTLALPAAAVDLADGVAAEQWGSDIDSRWDDLTPTKRRDVTRLVAEVVLDPGTKRDGQRFNRARLRRSSWRNDSRTWGDIWDV